MAKGLLEPATSGERVTVTLFRKQGGKFVKVAAKTVSVRYLKDRDGDGKTDGAYTATFTRPKTKGSYKVLTRFKGTPSYKARSLGKIFTLARQLAGGGVGPRPHHAPMGAPLTIGSYLGSLTIEHLFDTVTASFGPTDRRRPCSRHPSRPPSRRRCLSETSRSSWSTSRPPVGPPGTRRSRRSAPSSSPAASASARSRRWSIPEEPIPPFISHLTGIDDFLVREEPPIEAMLPAFLEFARGAVFVAHNARFDFSFLNENLGRLDYPLLEGPPVCTAKLAKRVVWPDVPNVRLHTLAQYFRTRVKPTHRALEDAMACAEVLDGLLDLGGRLGILTLGDLREAVRARGRPHYGKIRLADPLPHAAGVYRFVGRDERVLYVGKARDLRARVKSYFYGDGRKKIENLLGEVRRVEGDVTPGGELEALVLEARLIHQHEPKYNRRGKTWRRFAYLKVDPSEAYPRLKVVHRAGHDDGCTYLGPFSGGGAARLAKEALEDVVPLRSCTRAMRARTRFAPCALADIGRCPAPCDGRIDPERYGELVRDLLSSLESPDGLLEALEVKMRRLADAERFEEAASVRDRLRTLAAALHRARRDAWLLGAGRLELVVEGDRRLSFDGGALARAGAPRVRRNRSLPLPARARRRALGGPLVAHEESRSRPRVRRSPRRARERRGADREDPPVDQGRRASRNGPATLGSNGGSRGRPPRPGDVGDLPRHALAPPGLDGGRVLLGTRARELDRLP